MNNNQLIIFLFLLTSGFSFSQEYLWSKTLGSTQSDVGRSIKTDAAGNVYTVGTFQGTIDFNPGAGVNNLTSLGYDIFITKFNAAGNFIWAKRVGGTGYDIGHYLTIDPSGNLIITGYFSSTVDFDPGAGTASLTAGLNEDIYILKLDSNGNYVWAKAFLGGGLDRGMCLSTDAAGNVYSTGWFSGTVDYDPGAGTANLVASGSDVFVCKLSSAGSYVWAKKWGGSGSDLGRGISVDNAGNVFTTGNCYGIIDFDPGSGVTSLSSAGMDDIFVSKLDTDGNFIWARKLGGTGVDWGIAVNVDPFGNVYNCGYFNNTADFDPGISTANLTSAGGQDGYVCKLDNNGNFIWRKQVGGTGDDYTKYTQFDALGNIYVIGSFENTVDLNPGPGVANFTSAGELDAFVCNYDANGNYIWAKQIGGTLTEYVVDIAVESSGNILLTGQLNGTTDFNPGSGVANHTTVGLTDIFICKLGSCLPIMTQENVFACDSYTWDGTTYTSSGAYTNFYNSMNGCDSSHTINLTIGSNSHTLTQEACDSFSLNGVTYQQSGLFTQNFTNINGCDSSLILQLTIHTSFTTNLSISACENYNLNGQNYTQTGIYSQSLTSVYGCDSIVTLNLIITTPSSETLTATACDNYSLNGQTYTQSGTYTQNLINAAGCDSTLILDLTILNSSTNTISATACNQYHLNGLIYTQSGTYTQLLTNENGCDSMLTLNLVVHYDAASIMNVSACESYSLNGQTYTQTGTYFQYLATNSGCDSTITLNLTIHFPNAGTESIVACESYTWNGSTYSISGTYTANLINENGCDSLATLLLTVNEPTSSSDTIVSCDSYTWNNNVYTSSGTYSNLFTNANGCDSTATLFLTIHQSSVFSENITSCQSYTWNGFTYTNSGTYLVHLTNVYGCDSTVTLNLTINDIDSTTLFVNACGEFTWTNGLTYNQSGVYEQVLSNSMGCDSTIILDLTINPLPEMSIQDNEDGSYLASTANAYQWIDCQSGMPLVGASNQLFVPSNNGSYAVIGIEGGCQDTSDCIQITNVGIVENQLEQIHLYPNPFSNNITLVVNLVEDANTSFELLDCAGNRVITGIIKDENQLIDTQLLSAGIYFFNWKGSTTKLVKI